MTLPVAPNSISMSQLNVELGLTSTAKISLNDTVVRTLLGKSSGTISLSDAYSKSAMEKLPTPVVTYTAGLGSITFNWDAITGAKYWYYFNGSVTAQEASTNSYKVSGLESNESRTIQVYYTKAGFINSEISTLVTGYSQKVVTITGLKVVAGLNSLTFSWTAETGVSYTGYLDNGTVTTVTSPVTYPNLSQQEHTFTLNAAKPGFVTNSSSISGTPVAGIAITVNASAITGTLSATVPTNYYTFTAPYNLTYTIPMNKVTSTLDPTLKLYTSSGTLVASNDDGGSNYNALISKELTAGTSYVIHASSTGQYPYGDYTIGVTRPPVKLATPVFTSSSSTTTSVSFEWSPVTNATKYEVILSGGGMLPITYYQTKTSFTSSGSLSYGTYTLSVVAQAPGETSSDAATSSKDTVATAPTSISLLTEPTSTNIKITVSTTGPAAASYKLTKYADNTYTSVSGDPISQVSNVFNIAGTAYTTLYFVVEAYGSTGQSISSGAKAAMYADAVGKPTLSLSNNTTGNSFTITVTAANATDFSLYTNTYALVGTNKTGVFNITNKQPNSPYSYIGFAANPGASSAWSDMLDVQTPSYSESVSVAISNIQSQSATATITYTGPRTVKSYTVEVYSSDDLSVPKFQTGSYSNVVAIPGLLPTFKYYVKVTVVDVNNGVYSSTISEANSFTTPAAVVVDYTKAPSTLTLSIVSRQYAPDYTVTVKLSAGTEGTPKNYILWKATDEYYGGLNSPITNQTGIFTLPLNTGWITGYGSNDAGSSPDFSNIIRTY